MIVDLDGLFGVSVSGNFVSVLLLVVVFDVFDVVVRVFFKIVILVGLFDEV